MSAPVDQARKVTPELLLGLSATLLSLCALVVSIVQTGISRQQQHASAWPFLELGDGLVDDKFSFVLENKGMGPAVIKRLEVAYRGQAFPTLPKLLNTHLVNFSGPRFFVELRPHRVVKAGEEMELFRIEGDKVNADRLRALASEEDFVLRVTYADVYDNCWVASTTGVKALPRCPDR